MVQNGWATTDIEGINFDKLSISFDIKTSRPGFVLNYGENGQENLNFITILINTNGILNVTRLYSIYFSSAEGYPSDTVQSLKPITDGNYHSVNIDS